jgi:hypothetical protein
LCSPNKQIISSDPTTVAAADWSRFDWATQHHELEEIAAHAAALQLWTVVGAVHRLSEPHRPHNSLYVTNDHGRVVTRYDERMLSHTKISHMYTPCLGAAVLALLRSGQIEPARPLLLRLAQAEPRTSERLRRLVESERLDPDAGLAALTIVDPFTAGTN